MNHAVDAYDLMRPIAEKLRLVERLQSQIDETKAEIAALKPRLIEAMEREGMSLILHVPPSYDGCGPMLGHASFSPAGPILNKPRKIVDVRFEFPVTSMGLKLTPPATDDAPPQPLAEMPARLVGAHGPALAALINGDPDF